MQTKCELNEKQQTCHLGHVADTSTAVTVLLQDGFQDFVNRCEGAEFEDAVLAQQGKMSLRDLQKMRQSAGNQYATKPASELAMDHREAWEVLLLHLCSMWSNATPQEQLVAVECDIV